MLQYVYVVESRMELGEPFQFGTVWASAESATKSLEDYARDLNESDPEANAWVELLDSDDDPGGPNVVVARSHEFGFCDSHVVRHVILGGAR